MEGRKEKAGDSGELHGEGRISPATPIPAIKPAENNKRSSANVTKPNQTSTQYTLVKD